MNKILIATDGSPSALQAIEFGLELAADQDAIPIFVHVVPRVEVLPIMPATGFAIAPIRVTRKQTAEDMEPLEEAVRMAEERGLSATTRLLIGEPEKKIVEFADWVGADLIVVGSRGHGGITSALLGSVSRGILHEAKRPVLVVRETRQPVLAGLTH